MVHCIAYVGGRGDLPVDLAALDREAEFDVLLVPGTDGGVEGPLPTETTCVVVDHDPPQVDGLAAAAWLRDRYPELPVVLYPSVESRALSLVAVNAGFDAYVPRSEGGQVGILRSQLRRLSSRTGPSLEAALDFPDDATRASGEGTEPPTEGVLFEALLTSLPRWVSVYVKDRLGRHLAVSGSPVAFEEGSLIHSPDGKVLHSREDVVGKTDYDLYPPDHATQTLEQERRIMRTEEPDFDVSETVTDSTGSTHYYSTTKAPWYDETGTVAGIVGITVNITDRIEKTRALERQNERLDRFAGVLSHDLRNPLNVARGQLDIALASEDLPASLHDPLDEVDWALDRIEELVADTLELARQGSAVEDPEPTDVAAVARDAWRACGGDEAHLECDPDLPTIQASPERLQTLLENLFRNAHEHGGESVTVGVLSTDAGFAVVDDGPGIPPEEREEIFDEGYTTADSGTGFGLAIVRDVATAHGWTVAVAESDHGGARFEFDGVPTVED